MRYGVAALAVMAAATTVLSSTPAHASGLFDNCTSLHTRWPHGVGRLHAHDATSGTPVTAFKHSNRLYHRAITHNAGLDRDHDKIACESA